MAKRKAKRSRPQPARKAGGDTGGGRSGLLAGQDDPGYLRWAGEISARLRKAYGTLDECQHGCSGWPSCTGEECTDGCHEEPFPAT